MEHDFRDASRGERIQKVLASAGLGSRRSCEELISEGVVRVNGHLVADLPAWVDPDQDRITVRGKAIRQRTARTYVMLFKPRGTICTNDDPEGRTRAIDLIKHPSKARLFPVGRLDQDSSGLLLMTDDGELAQKLTHPSHEVARTYEIIVKGRVEESDISRLRRGIFLSDGRTAKRASAERLQILRRDRDRTRMRLILREGRNRQIRRMLARLGFPVKKLQRTAMGTLNLKGLQPGQWRDLTTSELRALRRATGLDPKSSR
ncbi:MAG: pseudouridine synthase [Phycisphaerae bacterium]|nr:pseudouridine synthase [Phycisphaerae bacterium]|tara:strand:+ start:3121 stop:3903 length:783 start_codon:yes stop_codon:yes gene_type:complete